MSNGEITTPVFDSCGRQSADTVVFDAASRAERRHKALLVLHKVVHNALPALTKDEEALLWELVIEIRG